MHILLLILGLILFISLVVVHELGHFIVARRNGVEVEEFGIFFPPRIWKKRIKSKKGDYDFTINALPLGGFVKLKGELDSDTSPGSFGAAKLWPKVKIMLAGVTMNLLAAFVILTFTALVGIPKLIDKQFTVNSDTRLTKHAILIGYVDPHSPAQQAGLRVRDQLISIGLSGQSQNTINTPESLPKLTRLYAGKDVEVRYQRNDKISSAILRLRSTQEVDNSKNTNEPKGYLGVSPTEYALRRSTWSAPIVAGGLIEQLTELTFQGLGTIIANLFRGNVHEASQQVSGPVGIYVILRDGSLLGYQFILMIIAIISLTLAIMNVLPIPALDGGRLFVTLAFRISKKPLSQRTEELIHGTGFVLLLALFALITFVDVGRFF
ncbi:site-2 protease family protein [Candidatus Saccharibacteria bacterium]|nr:site-2 protease family protein [Candidatus Saccharibacteria bacterium]MBI3338401.1 site-2 protease family protein [Candidatus Saccharibacteria bacterium]